MVLGMRWTQLVRSFATSSTQFLLKSKQLNPLIPLLDYAPSFYTKGECIQPLYEPTQFYTQLKSHILGAKHHIYIAALYIGQSEQELVDTIRQALSQSRQLQVHILIDCLRGTRLSKGESSATLLLPLIRDYPDQIKVAMYHTPDLKGLLKRTLPQRFNETIGLMHLKLYGFDDKVMLSGANLSTDYFTNRQDRYMLFHHSDLSRYYRDLLHLISQCSYQLKPDPEDKYRLYIQGIPDPVKQSRDYRFEVHRRLNVFMDKYMDSPDPKEEEDTVILPVIQMGPFHIRQDEKMTLELLKIANRQQQKWTIDLTSGYFNFTDQYKSYILKTQAKFKFLTASPEANGFFNSKGVSRFLPPAYTFIERQFYKQVKKWKRQQDIFIHEYKRPGWTYHAKGLWVSLPNESKPSLTMIGSPNFGQRSSKRDLEAQVMIITTNPQLRTALNKEISLLHQHSELITSDTFNQSDRKVPNGVKIATAFVKTML
ncbi:hypothetical protein BDB01DRAFT_861943 [Pilobolus umbonatus]|nr:hypothetical protein BDB01DRAFT_861943 [Pilobolus umbonatus]